MTRGELLDRVRVALARTAALLEENPPEDLEAELLAMRRTLNLYAARLLAEREENEDGSK